MSKPTPSPEELAARVVENLRAAYPAGRLGVAFSGGVDSTVLLALAARALGAQRVLAFTAVSEILAAAELQLARKLAADIGVELVEMRTHELANPAFVKNPTNRCYLCRAAMFAQADKQILTRYGLAAMAFGENLDDQARPDRPGSRAATEAGIARPLADAGLTKADVRAVAAYLGLPNATKPAAPCLATRIPHGQTITAAKLQAIEALENSLRALGAVNFRGRCYEGPTGLHARIELDTETLARVRTNPGLAESIRAAARAAGFDSEEIDPRGIQSGVFTLTALAAEN